MQIDLLGKNVWVAGSTKGIGKACALAFAHSGANVTLIARNQEKLKQTLLELDTTKEQKHYSICADFTQAQTLKKEIDHALKNTSSAHILINNTGGPAGGSAIEAQLADFENAFRQHLICNQILVQAVVDGMKKEKYGRIINIISTSVKQPIPGLGVSNTIRGAVANWSKTLATELGPFGITVNNILPGATSTERLDEIIHNKSEKTGQDNKHIKEAMMRTIPAGRFAAPEEIAHAVLFLSSPFAAYINGINLPVDGGRTSCL